MSTFKMGFYKFLAFTAFLLIWKTCRVQSQPALVEYINQPYTSSAVATSVQPSSQFVVPALIKPMISPYDSCIQETAPSVPNFGGYNSFNGYNQGFLPSSPPPMPPIIIDDGDDDDSWHHLLYFLIFAMRNRGGCGGFGNGGGYGGGYGGGCGCGGGCSGGCGGYSGGCNGGCGGYSGGCNGGCGGYSGGYGDNCGGGCGGGYGNSGSCGCGNSGGYSNGNNFGCGCGCSYIPYPIPVPMNGAYPYSFPNYGYPDTSYGTVEETYQTGQTGANEINLIIRTDSNCCC